MQIQNVPFCVTQWDQILPTEHPGETGISFQRMLEMGNIRVRIVEYKPGYLADHWCSRGHVLLVLEGELVVDLQGGPKYSLAPGTSFQVADDQEPHRVYTQTGAKAFIVD